MNSTAQRYCAIVPGYQEEKRIADVVRGILAYGCDVLVVDDGSADATAQRAREAGAQVIRHPVNLGKGAALHTGFQAARDKGYDAVITLDADGQHDPADIPAFVEAYRAGSGDVLIGNRMENNRNMPLVRKLTNRFMSWLLSREMGQRVPDTQCGYRLFGIRSIPASPPDSPRFAAESEVLLDLAEQGVRFGAVPIRVIYGDEKSKIHPFRDTLRFFGMMRRRKKRRAA